ncbi:MAG: hypothetical protein WC384_05900 [Prolixibacteraceae bacterium]|jgi:hypothetical protein
MKRAENAEGMTGLSKVIEIMSHLFLFTFLDSPRRTGGALLHEERGGGRLRARGESKRGKTQNLLCFKHFSINSIAIPIKVPGYRNIQPAGSFNCNLH